MTPQARIKLAKQLGDRIYDKDLKDAHLRVQRLKRSDIGLSHEDAVTQALKEYPTVNQQELSNFFKLCA